MNEGERKELSFALALIYYRDRHEREVELPHIGQIDSVGFAGREYKAFPNDVTLGDIQRLSDDDLERFCRELGISKSGARSKADIHINGVGISVKYEGAAPPAIVNHTPRHGWEMAAKLNHGDMSALDEIINQYWSLRKSGGIREDISNEDFSSPFRDNIKILLPFLKYFTFMGTGSGPSTHPAKFLLEFSNLASPQNWKVLQPSDAVETLWDRLVFSVRSKKGMPSGYPNNSNRSNNASIARWTEYYQGYHRGALHVRAK
jgi:hypothetical protein